MPSRLLAVVLDCHDAEALARFWCAVFGSSVSNRWTDSAGTEYVEVGLGEEPPGAVLLLQPVADPKPSKNRLHLDLAADDRDQAGEVARLVELGAVQLSDPDEHPWVVMADPEGNEFCVLPRRGL
ncbi:MAG TPA: VOC family protein [Pseudonocardia sp.]|jgi:catechol 2,3-dioxygenase-like lactoylglutathione lyase family enzyme|nr:VOC family protein [Pseudonocardia sp.]